MAVRSTKGLKICLLNDKATGTDIAAGLSNITNANPAVLTVTATGATAVGDLVLVEGTGTALDGNYYIVGAKTATDLTLTGADLSDLAGPVTAFTGTPKITVYDLAASVSTDTTCVCAASIGVNTDTPSPVSVATFCDPTATVPGNAAGAGTLDLTVYHDPADGGFKLLEKLSETGDKTAMVITFPGGGGHLVASGTISSFQIADLPIEGAASWSAQITLASKPKLLF